MCGFVGILSPRLQVVDVKRLQRMISTILHRGPDEITFHCEPQLGVGFCRLAIIDVAGGRQPMWNENESVSMVFNGEIYNYQNLRTRLISKGHVFRTECDSEVIVHGFEEWGAELPSMLRGIFAFAVWDRNARRLFLARDRSGVKPLYWARIGGEFRFASEAKAILVEPDASRELDILGYLGTAAVENDNDRTPFKNVWQLGAGCRMWADFEGNHVDRYWRYTAVTTWDGDDIESIVQRYRREFYDVVGMQKMSEVPLGAYLSGGIDSTAVVACAVQQGAPALETYTVAFEGGHSEDRLYAQYSAQNLGIVNRCIEISLDNNSTELLANIAWYAEGEFDLGYLGRYVLAQTARNDGIKVILTGQGADELLAGYHQSFQSFSRSYLARRLVQATWPSYRGLPPLSLEMMKRAGIDTLDHSEEYSCAQGEASLTVASLRRLHGGLSRGLLRLEDRMGMAAGIEVRVPYLDHRLIEILGEIPQRLRYQLLDDKKLLRLAVSSWVPSHILARPKFAFNAECMPISRLVLSSSRSELKDLLLSAETIKRKGYFEVAQCQSLLEQQQYTRLDHVLILHLLDELFVSRFDTNFACSQKKLLEKTSAYRECTNIYASQIEGDAKKEISAETVLCISRDVARIVWCANVDPDTDQIEEPRAASVAFVQDMRDNVQIPLTAARLLKLLDGRSSLSEIQAASGEAYHMGELLRLSRHLLATGVIELRCRRKFTVEKTH